MKTIAVHHTQDGCGVGEYASLRRSGYVDGPAVCAVLDFSRWPDFKSYRAEITARRADVRQNWLRAQRKDYRAWRFPWKAHLEDVAAINLSAPARQGRAMAPSYRRTAQEMGGEDKNATLVPHACQSHFNETWGVFGDRLVAYVSVWKTDDLAVNGMILGHRDHLRDGIMALLWFTAVERAWEFGARAYLYAGWNDGTPGLRAWKERLLLEPTRLVTA